MSEIDKIDEENNVTTADAAAEEPASSNGDSGGPDTDLEGWFLRHKIPYTHGVQISLDDWGVQCVEQLKLLPSDVFLGMYEAEKLVVRETAVSEGYNNALMGRGGLFISSRYSPPHIFFFSLLPSVNYQLPTLYRKSCFKF